MFALLTWAGVLGLGAQPEVWRLSDDPFSAEFWQSHYWAGVAVVGLMLFSLAARPEILRDLRWRRLHLGASILAAVLFVAQGITGSRDLLEIPLNWQKPTIYACDPVQAGLPALRLGGPACPTGRPSPGRQLRPAGRPPSWEHLAPLPWPVSLCLPSPSPWRSSCAPGWRRTSAAATSPLRP